MSGSEQTRHFVTTQDHRQFTWLMHGMHLRQHFGVIQRRCKQKLWKVWNGWQRAGRFGAALVLVALFMAGAYSTWNGGRIFVEARQGTADLAARIASLPERVVVADAWFIPQGAPYTPSDKLWFMAEDEKSMFRLLQMLRKTTPETSVIYLSSPYWAHVDPQVSMGPRLALIGDPPDPNQYITIARYQLLR